MTIDDLLSSVAEETGSSQEKPLLKYDHDALADELACINRVIDCDFYQQVLGGSMMLEGEGHDYDIYMLVDESKFVGYAAALYGQLGYKNCATGTTYGGIDIESGKCIMRRGDFNLFLYSSPTAFELETAAMRVLMHLKSRGMAIDRDTRVAIHQACRCELAGYDSAMFMRHIMELSRNV